MAGYYPLVLVAVKPLCLKSLLVVAVNFVLFVVK